MGKTMLAGVFHGPGEGRGLKVEEVPRPEPTSGELLVRIAACGICRTDLHYLHGTPTFRQPPLILGHEVSGVVAESADGADQGRVGQHVLIPPVFPCGSCRACLTGRSTICERGVMLGNHRDGGFAQFIAVPADMALPLPDSLPLEEGAVISDAVATPYHALFNRGGVKPGDSVVVYGCGGVGLSAVSLASSSGASVIAVDVAERKLALAREFGAARAINADQGDATKEIRRFTGGGADVALECIGDPRTIKAAFDAVRPGGRLVVVGYASKDAPLNAGRLMFREIDVVGSLGCGVQDYPKVFKFLTSGAVDLKRLVTHRFSLTEMLSGFELLERGDPAMVRGIVVPK